MNDKTICLISNGCKNKYLCCHFCKEDSCDTHCEDDHVTCKYLAKKTRIQTGGFTIKIPEKK